jgi:ABC-type Fe3+-siderophore transport system permease subunit
MWYLLASFILTNLLHGWLVLSQRGKNPASISYHSVKNRTTLLVYICGHLLSGALLWLLVNDLFGNEAQSHIILGVTSVAVLSEWLQALLPARGKTDKTHTVFATVMASSMALLVVLCTLFFAPNRCILAINLMLSAIVVSFFFFIRFPPKPGTWKLQFAGQIILYLQVFLLVY